MKVETCKSCGASIFWVRSKNHKWMPLDSKPEKRFLLEERNGQTYGMSQPTFMPHWATCPDADQWRRK